jgi:hypothetical protein
MDRRWEAKGHVVVLLGALAFVVGCFLPYYDYRPSGIGSVSLYRLYMFGLGDPGISVGGVLVLFAGVATLVWGRNRGASWIRGLDAPGARGRCRRLVAHLDRDAPERVSASGTSSGGLLGACPQRGGGRDRNDPGLGLGASRR